MFAENISASTTVMRVWGASEFIRKPRIKFVRKKIFCELKISVKINLKMDPLTWCLTASAVWKVRELSHETGPCFYFLWKNKGVPEYKTTIAMRKAR